MAHSRSALKRVRQNEKRRIRNRSDRSRLRSQIKKVRQALGSANVETARALLPQTASVVDRLVKKRVLRRRAGSRYLSRLSRQVAAATSR